MCACAGVEANEALEDDDGDDDDDETDEDDDDEDIDKDADKDESTFCVRIDHQRRSAISTLHTHTEASSTHQRATSGVRTGITDGDDDAINGTQ